MKGITNMDSTTTDAERELLEAERLCALTLASRERALHDLATAREYEIETTERYMEAEDRRDAARRALQDAYQNEVVK